MKIKKEPVILAAIITALILYLVLRNNDRTNYKLPDIAGIPVAEISGIEISGPAGDLSLKKTDNKWVIGPQGYPADSLKVQGMLEVIEKPVITTMASESKNYSRYGLEKDKKILVKAFSKGSLAREIEIGDTTGDKRQTFIKLSNDYRVYYFPKNIRTIFDKETDDLRDKAVLSFDTKEITKIDITKGAQVVRLILKQAQAEKVNKSPADEEKSETRWEFINGGDADKSSTESFLDALSGVSCKKYLYDVAREALTEPVCTVRMTGKKEYTLSIFAGKDNDNNAYPAISSENSYAFILTDSVIEEILNAPDKLLPKNEKQ